MAENAPELRRSVTCGEPGNTSDGHKGSVAGAGEEVSPGARGKGGSKTSVPGFPVEGPSEAAVRVAGDITKSGPASSELRGRDPKEPSPLSEKQVTAFRPGNGTTYRNEAVPRIPVEFTPEEAVQVLRVLTTGYASYTHREALFSGRQRLEQAVGCEQGPGGVLDERRAA